MVYYAHSEFSLFFNTVIELKVNLKEAPYSIYIVKDNFTHHFQKIISCLDLPSRALIVTNKKIATLYLKKILSVLEKTKKTQVFFVPDSERAKSFSYFLRLINRAVNFDKLGNLFFVALGGGVIGDLTGFCASVYRRGVSYIQIPTTLLAQVDSSIGGKTAIDLESAKNMVGSFYQPKAVISYLGFLKSLSTREIINGGAEIAKYGVIKNRDLFYYLKDNLKEFLRLKREVLFKIIYECVSIKKRIIELDEKEERGIRTILNFGHTLGHAIESATFYKKYSHGQAISIGMVLATQIALKMKMCKREVYEEIKGVLEEMGLPVVLRGISFSTLIHSLLKDKKFKKGKIRMVLPQEIGKAKVIENIDLDLIKEVIKNY